MRILDLAQKDIQQIIRDWKSGLFLLVMPIIFTLFFGIVMGSAFNPPKAEDPRLPVGVSNLDGGSLAASLEQLLNNSEVIRPVILAESAGDANQLVDQGELTAVLIVPNGFTETILADQPVSMDVIVNTQQPAGHTVLSALETVTARLAGAVEAAHISLDTAETLQAFSDAPARQDFFQDSLAAAVAAWAEPPLSVDMVKATGAMNQDDPEEQVSGFAQSSPGMMLQFAIFGLITSAMVLVTERKSGTLQRLLSTPMRRSGLIAGHILAMFLVVFAQQIILVLMGQFVFQVDYFRQPLAVLLLVTVLSLWAASLGLLISVLAKKEDQVITMSLIAMFIFAALGGAWFPLEVAGKTFAAIGHLMPTAWAMDGLQNILIRGLGFQSVLLPAAILGGYTLVFFGLAIWRFRFE